MFLKTKRHRSPVVTLASKSSDTKISLAHIADQLTLNSQATILAAMHTIARNAI